MSQFTGHNLLAWHNLFIHQSAVAVVEKTSCILPSRDAHGASVYCDHKEDPSGECVGPPMPGEQGERAPLSLSASSLLTLNASSAGAEGVLSNRAL
jgi:hypothetical protein